VATASRAGRVPSARAVDDPRETVDFGDRRGEVGALAWSESALEVLETQPQGGHRRPQLMGGVGNEGALRVEQLLQPVGHLVDRLPESPELGWAAPDRCPLGEQARAEGRNGRLDPGEGPREGAGQHNPDCRRHGQHGGAEGRQLDPVVGDASVQGRRLLGDEENDAEWSRHP